MKKVRFRMHRGGLLESLATTVSVENLNDVRELFSDKNGPNGGWGSYEDRCNKLTCEFYGYDDRIGWKTYCIKDSEGCIIGFSDGELKFISDIEYFKKNWKVNKQYKEFSDKCDEKKKLAQEDKSRSFKIKEIWKDKHGTLYWKYENIDDVNKRKKCKSGLNPEYIIDWNDICKFSEETRNERIKSLEKRISELEVAKPQWISADDKLPQNGQYVLIRNNMTNWIDKSNPEGPRFDVAKFEKGLSINDRKILKTGSANDRERAKVFSSSDEDSNNQKPYCWSTFGPMKYFGQQITHWMPIPEFEEK